HGSHGRAVGRDQAPGHGRGCDGVVRAELALIRHPREGGGPGAVLRHFPWVPAFAGTTRTKEGGRIMAAVVHDDMFTPDVIADPAIDESDLGLYEYVRNYQADQFIKHDRPEHLDMRKIVHGYFTPKAMESWRPFVVNAVKELLDAAEEKGSMDVMRDLATPLP